MDSDVCALLAEPRLVCVVTWLVLVAVVRAVAGCLRPVSVAFGRPEPPVRFGAGRWSPWEGFGG